MTDVNEQKNISYRDLEHILEEGARYAGGGISDARIKCIKDGLDNFTTNPKHKSAVEGILDLLLETMSGE